MSVNAIQNSFLGGELAPSIYARTDMAKYFTGAALMRNFFVDYRNGASTRMGTALVAPVFISQFPVRLIPFVFSNVTTYVLEFGNQYVRFINNGGMVLETNQTVGQISNSNPATVTIASHGFVAGDWVFIFQNNTQPVINGFFIVGGTITTNTFQIFYTPDGAPVDSTLMPVYGGGAFGARVYKIASPYLAADLALLKFAQNQDTMTITHPTYDPNNLKIIAPTNWTLTPIIFTPTILPPSAPSATSSVSGTYNYVYQVTAVSASGEESRPTADISAPNVANFNTTQNTITVSWTASVGAVSYNVFRAEGSISGVPPGGIAHGFIGTTTSTSFIDSNIGPDFTTTPPVANVPFNSSNRPACVSYFQQREVYAGSNQFPQTFYMSQPGRFNNFDVSNPVQADDSVTGTLVSNQVNSIKSMLPMPGGMLIFASSGVWQVTGGGGGGVSSSAAVTPANISAVPQAYNGASDVPPLVINYNLLYVQNKGTIVRDMAYNIYANIYTGTDVSILSNHLFFGHQLLQWGYAEEPFKVIWTIREDGIALSLTYLKEQEISGWAQHDTQGLFQSVATVTESGVDAVYFIVKRFTNNNNFAQFIERQVNRTFPYGREDAWSVDCAVQSSPVFPVATLTPSAASGTGILFVASAPSFVAGNVGAVIRVGGGIGTIASFISSTQVTVNITQPITTIVPNTPFLPGFPAGTWSMWFPNTQFFGLHHLIGQTVSILADGVASTQVVAANGSVTLLASASKVTIGLKFTPQLQTLNLDTGAPTIQGKRMKIDAVTVRAVNTLALKVGRTFGTLVPMQGFVPGANQQFITGDVRTVVDPLWDLTGRVCFQLDDPFPATISGVIREISVGDDA